MSLFNRDDLFSRNRSLSFKTIRSGGINSILFWFDVLLESPEDAHRRGRKSPLGFTSCPIGLSKILQKQNEEAKNFASSLNLNSFPYKKNTQDLGWCNLKNSSCSQALQMIPELIFEKDEYAFIIATHTKSCLSFQWDTKQLSDLELRKR